MLTAIVHCTRSHQQIHHTRRIKHFASIISLHLQSLRNVYLHARSLVREMRRLPLTMFQFGPSSGERLYEKTFHCFPCDILERRPEEEREICLTGTTIATVHQVIASYNR